jgi:hypothetical protein
MDQDNFSSKKRSNQTVSVQNTLLKEKDFVKEFVKFYEDMKYLPDMAVKIQLSKLYEKAYELEHPEEFLR